MDTVFRREVDNNFLEPLEIVAIVKSTSVIPNKIVILYKITSSPDNEPLAPPTSMEP
jgi:hypothetical protein